MLSTAVESVRLRLFQHRTTRMLLDVNASVELRGGEVTQRNSFLPSEFVFVLLLKRSERMVTLALDCPSVILIPISILILAISNINSRSRNIAMPPSWLQLTRKRTFCTVLSAPAGQRHRMACLPARLHGTTIPCTSNVLASACYSFLKLGAASKIS